MAVEFYHASRELNEIEEFNLLSHFGTMKAAFDRAGSIAFAGIVDPYIYKVSIDFAQPLLIDDLHKTNHSWLKLTDYLHYTKKIISADERGHIFEAAAPGGSNTNAGNECLCRILQDKGYDAITYKNLHEDKGSISLIILNSKSISSIERARLSEFERLIWPCFAQPSP